MPVRRLNHAVLFVRDIACSVAFYSQVFDFSVEHEMPGRAAFLRARGSDNDHDLGLFTLGPDAEGPSATASDCTISPGRSAHLVNSPRRRSCSRRARL